MRKLLICLIICIIIPLSSNASEWIIHTVHDGETLGAIAKKYLPYSTVLTRREFVEDIRRINSIKDYSIEPGDKLRISITREVPVKPQTISKAKGFSAKGVYVNRRSASSREILLTAQKLVICGANTVVFDAKDDMGCLTYTSAIPGRYSPNKKYPANIEDLPKLIDCLHRMNVHVVARVVVFKDSIMASAATKWCLEKDWLNPANPEVQEYLLVVIRELVSYGIDEVQLDYIRYPANSSTSTGIAGVSRSDVIASFLQKVHEATSSKGVLLSIDMFGIVIWQRDKDVLVVGQDVNKMKPYVDIISPMLYPSHFSKNFSGINNPADEPYLFVQQGVEKLKNMVGTEVAIRPWLQSFPLRVTKGKFGPQYIQTQIEAAQDSGATGWLLWSPGNHYNDAYTAMGNIALSKAFSPNPVQKIKAETSKAQ
jgi:hypothetical protein